MTYTYTCEQCSGAVTRDIRPNRLANNPPRFCSVGCANSSRQNRVGVACGGCGTEFKRVASRIKEFNFCSRACKEKAQGLRGGERFARMRPAHYGKYSEYRRWALAEYGSKCQVCGYDKFEEVLEVHHRDGDRSNNSIENLAVLCLNCHGEKHVMGL